VSRIDDDDEALMACSSPAAALSHGVGAETARPFAVVIIGGLIADTLLTIFLVPLLYPYFEEKAAKG